MKICYFGNAKSVHVRRWAEYFAENGFEVHIISEQGSGYQAPNIHTHILPELRIARSLPYHSCWTNLLRIRDRIRTIDPDIVHGHHITDTGLFTALCGKRTRILTANGSDIYQRSLKNPVYFRIAKYSLTHVERVTTTSTHLAEAIRTNFQLETNRITTFPWGVDLDLFNDRNTGNLILGQFSREDHSAIVVSARGLNSIYNNDKLILAIPAILKRHPNTLFIILRGTSKVSLSGTRLEEIMERYSKNIVVVDDFIQREQLAEFLSNADIFISIPDSDQFALSVVEGMASGAIPIVSDLEVYREHLSHGRNAFFVDPTDVKQISEVISGVIEDLPSIKGEITKVNRDITEREFDEKECKKKMLEVYREVLTMDPDR